MTIYDNPEIVNTPVWILPNIRRLGQGRDTKFGTKVWDKNLLNACELLRENQQEEGGM